MSSVRITDYRASDESNGESLFYSPKWNSVLQKVYSFKMFTATDEAHDLRLHFALVDNIAGKKLVSLPFSDYTDIYSARSEEYHGIMEGLKSQFPKIPIILKTIGKNEKRDENPVFGRPTRKALYHRVPTGVEKNAETDAKVETGDVPKAKQLQSSSFRRNVRKAKKTGTTVAIKRDKAALENFYRMYHGLRFGKFGSIPQPFSFFEAIFEEFIRKDAGFLLEASHKEKPIASIIVLEHGPVLYYKFGASTEGSLDLRPNNLIFDRLISHALKNRFEAIDLGLSGTGDSYKGLVRFKESMGGEPTPITYYRSENGYQGSDRDTEIKKWLGTLTEKVVATRPDPEATSILSETIYPLFA